MPAAQKSDKLDITAPIVALAGFMAAGKSTVGRALAHLLRWRFIDLDCEIECRSTLHVHEIFAMHGEARFREIEADALRWVVEQAAVPTIIALGGGTYVQPQNAELLRRHGVHVVFLELTVEELLQRCRTAQERSAENPRPLAADAESFCTLYAQRLPHYRKANLTVDGTGKTVEQLARDISIALNLTASGQHRM
jgi:shikimate kinase